MTHFYLLIRRYLVVFLMLGCATAFAQRSISGRVTAAEDGSGIPGVNILEKGTTNGTASDFDGNFRLNVGDNATLVFSFIGYKTMEVPVGAQSTLNVTMELDVTALSEVVVIGYGQTTVKDATGAVAAVTSADFNGGVIASPEQLIQGKTAGVQITSASGAPGAGVQLRIRGTSSIRSNNNPLFVVDGVPLSGGTQPAAPDLGMGSSADTNPLNFLNPNDIESISILKDASATAIYGSRGANGVVIITTKSGKGNKGTFEVSSNVSVSSALKTYDLLERDQFLAGVAQYGGDAAAQDFGANTDWQDYLLRNSVSHKQNISYARGYETASIRAGLGYENQQGILENSYMKRFTARVNGSKSLLDDKLNLDLSATYSNVKREDPATSGSAGFQGDILGAAYSANPTWPTDPLFNPGGLRSPANILNFFQSTGTTNRILTNLSADYKLNDALTAKVTYGLDLSRGDRTTLVSGRAINAGNGVQGNGAGQLNQNNTTSNLVELTMNYTKEVGNIDIEVVGGYSVQSFRNQYYWAEGRGFADFSDFGSMDYQLHTTFDAADELASSVAGDGRYSNWGFSRDLRGGAPAGAQGFVSAVNFDTGDLNQVFLRRNAGVILSGIGANFYDQTDYLQSYFARGNFTINDKFLITATLRADGSSKFGKDNRYGVFPSGAIAYKLHEEDFLPDAFNNFKIRAGYGVVGNQDGLGYGEFVRRERWADVDVGDAREINLPGTTTQGSVNPGLKWESTTQISAGIDFGLNNDKISGSFDYYVKNTTDLLLRRNAAQPAVADQIFDNLDATVENKGWELSLSYAAIESSNASLSFSGNISNNKNVLKDFAGLLDAGTIRGQGLSGAYAQRLAGGQPLFSFFLREFGGFDANGQPIGDEQVFVGKSALPTWNMGFSINATYKNFDFNMYMSGQFGQYVYNNTKNGFFTAGSINNARNVTPDVLTNGESGSAEASVSTRFLEKGDFIRGQNLTLGYNIPVSNGGTFKKLRVSFNAQNLFLITDYSGLDPEVSSNPSDNDLLNRLPTAGIDWAAYPRPRTFTLGINASF
ncbi:MAG: SusC/RagA family TonB-linked outer membrane protein [Cyclobacteriaceae bacterium]